ncbi:RNA polymerase sigma factor [Croceitalea rosinachiae]|uniref:Sigma-70 family RNA polymerase sigma factor n=1 Tax=Croceitalea rosinachiae TaxID=3075596 RepID=A0ABU3A879_9FLAO|nr:sigma-70 family RNA polymerase sigma factor [Croceitalea sp. F388]MDT0606075.1 sigma-70 family RNA polymerase sigma factor [Croceitalea sp. F388]
MNKSDKKFNGHLTEHFFRNEYGKIVSVITRYIGVNNVETAEDIVQETLLKATDIWRQNGVPENPKAWLYKTAKNLTLNILKRKKYEQQYRTATEKHPLEFKQLPFSDEMILDEQLKMMFVCCHPSISENYQIALILKILCGFSITEIANAFFSTKETINKRLVRGRKQLRQNNISFEIPKDINTSLPIVQKTVYLLFNEGYSPTQKNELIRFDLCLEAIRLIKILVANKTIKEKSDSYALLALMHLNASRFEARMNDDNLIVEMEKQNRSKWNSNLIAKGIQYLNQAMKGGKISKYFILATISANHCIAKEFKDTNWKEILSLYNTLLAIEDSPTIRLNRAVALSNAQGSEIAIKELKSINLNSDIGNYHLFHTTLAELYKRENNLKMTIQHLKKAISLAKNKRDLKLLEKKLIDTVPIS